MARQTDENPITPGNDNLFSSDMAFASGKYLYLGGSGVSLKGDGTTFTLAATTLTLSGDLTITGDFTITGDLTVTGDFAMGDAAADTVTVSGDIVYGASTATYLIDCNAATPGTGDIRLSSGEMIDNKTNNTIKCTTTNLHVVPAAAGDSVLQLYSDANAYFSITQADGAAVTFASTSDGTAGFTFDGGIVTLDNGTTLDNTTAAAVYTVTEATIELVGSTAITLNGDTTVSGTKTFTTGTGAVTVKGDMSIDAGKDFDMSAGAGTFDTGTGNIGLNGDSLVATDKKIQFRDTALFLQSSTDGQLDIDADTELEITAPTTQIVASTLLDLDVGAVDIDMGAGLDWNVTVAALGAVSQIGGSITFLAGDGGTSGNDGGNVSITCGAAGSGSGGDGGDMVLAPGAGDGGGTEGTVTLSGSTLYLNADDCTVNASSNLNVSTGRLKVNSKKILEATPVSIVIPHTDAADGNYYGKFFVASYACEVVGASFVATAAGTDGGGVTLQIERLQGTETKGNGDDLLTDNSNAGFDLKGTAETVQNGTLVTSGAEDLAAGDRLGLVTAGTLTAVGHVCVTVWIAAYS